MFACALNSGPRIGQPPVVEVFFEEAMAEFSAKVVRTADSGQVRAKEPTRAARTAPPAHYHRGDALGFLGISLASMNCMTSGGSAPNSHNCPRDKP